MPDQKCSRAVVLHLTAVRYKTNFDGVMKNICKHMGLYGQVTPSFARERTTTPQEPVMLKDLVLVTLLGISTGAVTCGRPVFASIILRKDDWVDPTNHIQCFL